MTETDKRRPDFDAEGSEPIDLPGVGVWHFRKPIVEFFPVGGQLGSKASFGPGWDALMADYAAARDAEPFDMASYLLAIFAVGADLLRRNYDLSDEDMGALLRYRPGDESSREAWHAILSVAEGVGPKARRGGDESPTTS